MNFVAANYDGLQTFHLSLEFNRSVRVDQTKPINYAASHFRTDPVCSIPDPGKTVQGL